MSSRRTLSEQPIGTVITIGHPANDILAVRINETHWRYLQSGMLVDSEDFRAGWDLHSPAVTEAKPALFDLVGETVRVYYNHTDDPICTGKLVAVCPEPVLVIDDEDGVRHYHPSTLRREVARTEWIPA